MNAFIQPLKPAYFADVEKQLRRIFYEVLFAPLLATIERATAQDAAVRENVSSDPLRDALHSGRIQYEAGIFSGEFSAPISRALRRIGATFDSRSKVYRLHPSQVPPWVTSEATSYQMKARGTHKALLAELDKMQGSLAEILKGKQVNAEASIKHIEKGFEHAAEAMKVSPTLTPAAKEELKTQYTQNMNIWIQKFSEEEIVALRERVELNATQGYRFDRLINSIKNRYSVSENKAAFLARQETSLFLAKFREKRFADGGVRRYRWSTAGDERVRSSHAHLNGQVFSYDQPPITDPTTAARNNPGQDYNCRCVDIPVFEGQER